MGLTIVDTPPASSNLAALYSLAATPSGSDLDVTWTLPPGCPGADYKLDLWLTSPLSSGRKPKIQDAKHLLFTNAEDLAVNTGALYTGSYGVFARTISEASGLTSPWSLALSTIGAPGILSQGPNFPLSALDTGSTGFEWFNSMSARFADLTYATCTIPLNEIGNVLLFTHFGFAIPSSSTILGLVFEPLLYTDLTTQLYAQLYLSDSPIGDPSYYLVDPAAPAFLVFGSDVDLWSYSLTPSVVNDVSFGVGLSVQEFGLGDVNVYVDAARVTTFYST
jgi:hypothetical protein